MEVGFGGVFQVARWTPIRVAPANGESFDSGSVTVVDVDGRPVTFPLDPRSDGSLTGLFQSGRLDASIRVRAASETGPEVEHLLASGEDLDCLRQETQMWMLVGRHTGFERAAKVLNAAQPESSPAPAVQLIQTTPDELPTSADALDSLALLVLGSLELDQQRSQAVDGWVQRGGRLVLTMNDAGADSEESSLEGWLPVTIGESFRERQTTALTGRITAYVPNKGTLRSLEELQVHAVEADRGVVLIDGPSAPVVVRSAYGLGMVTVVGVNLEHRPFVLTGRDNGSDHPTVWSGLPQMCLQLAAEELPSAQTDSTGRELQLAPTGVSDLHSQLAGILDYFPEVRRASNWNVIGMLAAYLLVVGPLDWFLVHRLLGKPQLTWVTLPAWVLFAGWWASSVADSNNGDQTAARHIEFFDVAADTGVQRTSAWFSLYSPDTRRLDLSWKRSASVAGDAVEGSNRLASLARPEGGFRGAYRRGGVDLGGAGYEIETSAHSAVAKRVPINQWSSLAFAGNSYEFVGQQAAPIAECRQVTDTQGRLVRYEFSHQLPGTLEDWFAVERLQVTFPVREDSPVKTLAPGVTYNLVDGTGEKLLQGFLQGEIITEDKRKTGSQFYTRSEDYDPLGLDPAGLFRILSFHDAIGGRSYTRLNNRTLNRHDFSDFIHLDRLVVCGRFTQPVSQFEVDGDPAEKVETSTFVRLIVPIIREGAAARYEPSAAEAAARRDDTHSSDVTDISEASREADTTESSSEESPRP